MHRGNTTYLLYCSRGGGTLTEMSIIFKNKSYLLSGDRTTHNTNDRPELKWEKIANTKKRGNNKYKMRRKKREKNSGDTRVHYACVIHEMGGDSENGYIGALARYRVWGIKGWRVPCKGQPTHWYARRRRGRSRPGRRLRGCRLWGFGASKKDGRVHTVQGATHQLYAL